MVTLYRKEDKNKFSLHLILILEQKTIVSVQPIQRVFQNG